jgi:hypothetical protein
MGTWNPYAITNATDSFSVQSQGYYQGDVQADPATRFAIAAGIVASTETTPMWGGVAIYEQTPPAQVAGGFNGSIIARAYNDGAGHQYFSGFSVYNGSVAAPTNPQSTAPVQSAGFSFNFVRFGSGNRIVVACSSDIIALAGSANPQEFSWDPVAQELIPYSTSPSALTFKATLVSVNAGNSSVVVYSSGTGNATWNNSANAAVILI